MALTKPTLFIPYVNREDLLAQAWDSVEKDFDVIVIDNSPRQDLEAVATRNYQAYIPDIPLNFVCTQNLMLKLANQMQLPHYGFMHSDGEAVDDTPQKLIEFTNNLVPNTWGAVFTYYDVLAIFNTYAMNAIGGWSIYFEQYFADADTYRRLTLAGFPYVDTGLKVNHYNGNDASSVLKNDKRRAFRNNIVSSMFARIYKLRWGGDIGSERYFSPFNLGDLTI